jgi:pyridoxine kinase
LSSPRTILSIQSEVVTGHVGNGAARFALQRLGHEVWGVPTVLLSSHAGHPGFAGEALSAGLLQKLFGALETQGRLAEADGVLSGYLGDAGQVPLVADAVQRARADGRTVLYCLDPAFGDDGRIYARPGVAEAIGETLLPLADVVRANAFELATLSGRAVTSPAEAAAAARALARPIVVATSVPAGARLATVLVAGGETLVTTTPRIGAPPRGAGDLFTALLFGHMVAGSGVGEAVQRAVLTAYHILAASDGAPEMALIAEQAAIAAPPALPELRVAMLGSGAHG